jgi:hypothetical protein
VIVLSFDPGTLTGGGFYARSADLRRWEVLGAIDIDSRELKRGGRKQPVQVVTRLDVDEPGEAWGDARQLAGRILERWAEDVVDLGAVDVLVVEGIAYHPSGKGRGGQQLVDLTASAADLAGSMRRATGCEPWRPGWTEWVHAAWGPIRKVPGRKPGQLAAEITKACRRDLPVWGIDLGKLGGSSHAVEAAVMGRAGAVRRGRR